MRRRIAAGALLIAAAGCFSDRPGATDIADGSGCRVNGEIPIADSMHVIVIMRDLTFHPSDVTVPPGGTITWLHCESEAAAAELHTTTSDTDAWDSGLMALASTFTHTFDDAGDFLYHCEPHPGMRGRVLVR